jgi:hypothetical protein
MRDADSQGGPFLVKRKLEAQMTLENRDCYRVIVGLNVIK